MSVPGLRPLEPHGAFRAAVGLILELVAMDPLMALHVIHAGKLPGTLRARIVFEFGVGIDVGLEIAGASENAGAYWAGVDALLALLGARAGEFGRLGGWRWGCW